MARYVTFFSYTGEAVGRMVRRPGDREQAARELIRGAGGELDCFYWMFGPFDGFAVFDVPDAPAAAAVSLAVTQTGLFRAIETHQLLDSTQVVDALTRATAVAEAYEVPGGRDDWHPEYGANG